MTARDDTESPQAVDIPITLPASMAASLAEDLENGETVSLRVSREDAPNLPEHIDWQLENGEQITEFVEGYDGSE